MDLRKVKSLIELIEESPDISEIEIHEGEESVRISRSHAPSPEPKQQHIAVPATGGQDQRPAVKAAEGNEVIKSPMVGTFYRSPSPDAEPFVNEGDSIQAGKTLCIIEAMKMMNQIEAPTTGKVKKFLVENAAPVEFGQAIAIIQA